MTLGEVILMGTAGSMPSASIPGRLYFTTDTLQIFYDTGSDWDNVSPVPPNGSVLGCTFNGGGSALTSALSTFIEIPYDCTINSWSLLADTSGDVSVDIRTGSFSGYPTVSSIVASAPPTLSSAQKASSSTLTGWTTSLNAGDVIVFYLSSVSTITQLAVQLQVTRS
jgi:hypothetical protein